MATPAAKAQTLEVQLQRRTEAAVFWLQTLVGVDLSKEDLFEALKDGIVLCKAANAISPDSVKQVSDKKKNESNVPAFLKAAETLGVAPQFLFKPSDLQKGKNKMKILQTIFMLSYTAEKLQIDVPYLQSSDMKNVSKWVVAAADKVPSPASPLPIAGSSGAFDINVDQLLAALDAGQSSGTPPATGDASDTTSPLVERAHANASSSSGSVEKVVASRVAQAVTPIASRLEHLELVNKTMSIKLNEMIEKMTEAFTLQSSRMTLLESSVQVLLARSEEQDRAQKRILELLEHQATPPLFPKGNDKLSRKANASPMLPHQSDADSEESVDLLQVVGRRPRSSSSSSKATALGPKESKSADNLDASASSLKHSSSVESLVEEVSLPVNTAFKRQRWYETEIGKTVDTSTMTKEEINRQDAIYELIDSEADYVKDLQVVMDVHMKKLKEANLISASDMQTLFSNLPQLVGVNREMADILAKKRAEAPVVLDLCDVFIRLYEYFKIYTVYCSNHMAAGRLLNKLMSTNEEFKKLHSHCTNEIPETKHLTLESYLIKPVQRICKYPLLLRAISRETPPEHPDYANTQIAIEKIESVLQVINERTQFADESQRILLLQSKIESDEPLELLHPSRRLLFEGTVNKLQKGQKAKERYLVLFNDHLLICKPLSTFSKSRYQLQKSVPGGMFLVNPNTPESVDKNFKFVFQLIIVGQEKLDFGCNTEEEKNNWMKFLEQASMELIKKEATRINLTSANSASLENIASIPAAATGGVGEERSSIDSKNNALPDSPGPQRTPKALRLLGLGESSEPSSPAMLPKKSDIPAKFDPRKRRGSVDVLSIMSRTNQTDPETVDNLTEELFVTTRSYTATEDFEISFAADQLVLVVNRKKDDYWKVQMKDVVGWVLSRSVKPAEDIVGKATVIEKLKKIPNYNVTTCNAQAEKNKKKNMFTLGRKKENRTSLVDNRGTMAMASFGGSTTTLSALASSAASVFTSNSGSDNSSIAASSSNKHKQVSQEGFKAAGRTWRKVTNPDESVYYFCPESYETCLTLPSQPEDQGAWFAWIEEPVLEFPGWVEIDNNGLIYYYNRETNETVWNLSHLEM